MSYTASEYTGFVKSEVYATDVNTVEELKNRIILTFNKLRRLTTNSDFIARLHNNITYTSLEFVYKCEWRTFRTVEDLMCRNQTTMKMKKKKLSTKKVKSALSRITSIHGIKQLVELKQRRWNIWLTIFVGNVILTAGFIVVIKDHYNNDQIVTRIDANYKVNMLPFPAVSICNLNLVSIKESKNVAASLKKHNKSDVEIDLFFRNLARLLDFGELQGSLTQLLHMTTLLKQEYYQVDSVLEEVHQKCEDLLLYCIFNRKPMACSDIFNYIKTFEGFCCTFNYAALNDGSDESILFKETNDFEYYEDTENLETTNIITTSEFGRKSGLSVVFNVEPHDYPSWGPPYYGAKILISDPNDFPETTVITKLISVGDSLDLKIQPIMFQSDLDIRRISPSRRLCWFHNEVSLGHTDRYSFETCKTECKMNGYREICGCLPFKYPREKTTRLCEFQDLGCLRNITEYGSTVPCDPVCYAECGDKKYTMTSSTIPFQTDNIPEFDKKNLTMNGLSRLQVFFNKATCNCYRLSLLMDFNYMIATYGGVFSLSFGGSLITAFEIVYLIISFVGKLIHNWFFQECSVKKTHLY